MRCVARITIISVIVTILLIYVIFRTTDNNTKFTPEPRDLNDELAIRILQGIDLQGQNMDGGGAAAVDSKHAPLSVSVAVVLIICLASVALLITGIIIVAVTLDPNVTEENNEDNNSDLESADEGGPLKPSPKPPRIAPYLQNDTYSPSLMPYAF